MLSTAERKENLEVIPFSLTKSQEQLLQDAEEVLFGDGAKNLETIRDLEKIKNTMCVIEASLIIEDLDRKGFDLMSVKLPEDVPPWNGTGPLFYPYSLKKNWTSTEHIIKHLYLRYGHSRALLVSAVHAFTRRLKFLSSCQELSKKLGWNRRSLEAKRDIFSRQLERQIQNTYGASVPKVLLPFPEWLRSEICECVAMAELNNGCSVGCTFCAYSAEKKVEEALPFKEAAWLAMEITSNANFYRATDPLDYPEYDSFLTIRECCHGLPFTSTAYPEGSLEKVRKCGDRISRFSISFMNQHRLQRDKLFQRVGKEIIPEDPDIADGVFFGGTHCLSKLMMQLEDCEDGESIGSKLTGNTYSEFGIYHFQKNDDPDMKIVGKQRKVIEKILGKKAVPKFHASIHCKDGVTITPKKVMNSVPVFSTDKNPNGVIDVPLDPVLLQEGQKKIAEMALQLDSGKSIQVDEVLPFGIVEYQFRSLALEFPKSLKERGIEEDTLMHWCTIRIYHPETQKLFRWKCLYNLVDGTVISLKKVEE